MRCCIIPIAAHRPTRLRRTGTIPSNFLTQRGVMSPLLANLFLHYGDLEQYSLSAISALAERAVAALVPKGIPDRGPL